MASTRLLVASESIFSRWLIWRHMHATITCTHARTHACTRTCIRARTRICRHVHTHLSMHLCMHTHVCARTCTYALHMRVQLHVRACGRVYACTHADAHVCAHWAAISLEPVLLPPYRPPCLFWPMRPTSHRHISEWPIIKLACGACDLSIPRPVPAQIQLKCCLC